MELTLHGAGVRGRSQLRAREVDFQKLVAHGKPAARIAIQKAMAPIVVGLILSGGYVLCTPSTPDWRLWAIAAASGTAMVMTKLNPLWMLAAGGVAGAFLLQ